MWVSDSPQRAKILGCKHPNNYTKLPCPYCKAKQVDGHPTFGDLGNSKYNIERNRRTYGEAREGWKELGDLEANSTEQKQRATELGMLAPTSITGGGRPLFDKMQIDPARHVPVESLHADALVSRHIQLLTSLLPARILGICGVRLVFLRASLFRLTRNRLALLLWMCVCACGRLVACTLRS